MGYNSELAYTKTITHFEEKYEQKITLSMKFKLLENRIDEIDLL